MWLGKGFEEVCQLDRMAVFEGPSRDISYDHHHHVHDHHRHHDDDDHHPHHQHYDLNDLNNLVLVIIFIKVVWLGRGFEEVCQFIDRRVLFEGPSRDISYKIKDDDEHHQS